MSKYLRPWLSVRCIFAMSGDTFGHNLGKGLETQNAVNYPATHRTAPDPYRRLSDPKLSIGLRLRKINLKVYIVKDFHSSIN